MVDLAAASRATRLRELIASPSLSFLMEAHNGLSAKIAEEAGFKGLWGSGLSISAACGVRDNNELSWTQVLDILEYITDATTIPLLLDGDTGYGNFNNMRRLVGKLEARDVAGVCIEDKLYPKTNSFIEGGTQPLADIDEFAGKIKAGKDAQLNDDFCIVARVEALISGLGLAEALKRAEAYRRAGADAILIHSKLRRPDEVLAFKGEWGERSPVIIVPTMYYSTPTDVFRKAGFRVVIWANHLMRASMTSMQRVALQLHDEETLLDIEERIVPVSEVFRLQGAEELREAEKRYLPRKTSAQALVLAASRGSELGELTQDRPKAMVSISGQPLLSQQVDTFRELGLEDITVVRGYKKEAIDLPDLRYVDNDRYDTAQVVYSLRAGLESIQGPVLVSYGDVLFQKFIPMHLLESEADICLAVDPSWEQSQNRRRYGEFVRCAHPYRREDFDLTTSLQRVVAAIDGKVEEPIHGEWIGMMKLSTEGLHRIRQALEEPSVRDRVDEMRMPELFNLLLDSGVSIDGLYTVGHWFDIDEWQDVIAADRYRGPGQRPER